MEIFSRYKFFKNWTLSLKILLRKWLTIDKSGQVIWIAVYCLHFGSKCLINLHRKLVASLVSNTDKLDIWAKCLISTCINFYSFLLLSTHRPLFWVWELRGWDFVKIGSMILIGFWILRLRLSPSIPYLMGMGDGECVEGLSYDW